MKPSETHIPVLIREALDALNIRPGGIYIDATLGRAGHARAIAERMGVDGRLIGVDRDPQAVALGRELFKDDARVQVIHGEFSRLADLLRESTDVVKVDGVLMDLGVSSPQLDQAERGFSFMRDGELDMRMDPSRGESAADWLAHVDEAALVRVLFEFGEEKFARRIARAIVTTRDDTKIENTLQLAAIIAQATPKKDKHKHPATRSFQAIRLHVNQELSEISEALPQAVDLLNEGGRLAVISFHSLEDRIVKRFIRSLSTPNLPPKNIPVKADAYLTPLNAIGRAIKPSKQEISDNPRSRSSVLRIAQRTDVPYVAASPSSVGGARASQSKSSQLKSVGRNKGADHA
jgi:16S rRNA (cytosine1402-N4)-methyltransferase